MKIYLLAAIIVGIIPIIFYKKQWLRYFCVTTLLLLIFLSYFGIQTSSRLAITQREENNEHLSKDWQNGAVETRFIAQEWLPLIAVASLGLALLALVHRKNDE